MNPRIKKFYFLLVLGLGLMSLGTSMSVADDAKSPAKEPPAKIPDYSKYRYVKDMPGEVVKADDTKITIRVKWTENKNPNKNVLAPPKLAEMHKDYEYHFIPESLVRTSYLPKKTDEKGKKIELTSKEKEALQMPVGVKGYAASISDLAEGSTVNLVLIRDKSVSEDKLTEQDLKVKYAIIQSPPPTTTTPPPAKKQ